MLKDGNFAETSIVFRKVHERANVVEPNNENDSKKDFVIKRYLEERNSLINNYL